MPLQVLLGNHAGKLRTADCVAVGKVDAVVMSKREFQDLDNPLLAWMIDYDAVASVLKVRPPQLDFSSS